MMRARTLLAALAALLLLTASACGDDDEPTANPTADDGGDQGTAADDGGSDEGADEGDEASSGDTDVPDPCTLLTLADLEEIFGSTFDEGTLTDDFEVTGTRQCTWGGTEDTTAKVVSIAIGTDASQRAGGIGRGAEEMFELTRQSHDDSGAIDEPDLGLGDQSYRSGSGVYVLDGDTSYAFAVSGTSDEAIAQLEEMAQRVVGG